MSDRIAAALVAAFALAPLPALAQAPQTVPTANPCVDGKLVATGEPCDSLSQRLDQTNSVIRPPSGVDPDIAAPAPDPNPGTTPVIPPGAIEPQQSGTDDHISVVPK